MNDTIKRLVPSQVVMPVEIVGNAAALDVDDIGRVVAIRSLHTGTDVELLSGYNPKQVLHTTIIILYFSDFRIKIFTY